MSKISRQGSVTESKLTESSGEFPEVAKSQGDVRAPTVAKYRATTAATARISCRSSAEIVKSIPQERISERSQVSRVPKISCQESVEVDPVLLRTVKQFLDKGRESPS